MQKILELFIYVKKIITSAKTYKKSLRSLWYKNSIIPYSKRGNFMKKKVLVFCLFLALVISTTLIFQHPQTANASTLNFDTYTDSDYFLNSTNPNETIQKYKDNYFANKLTLPSSTFPHQIVPSNGYTANEDDDIIRIVPRELFNTIGTTLHIGIEYGFFISVSDHYEYGKRATVLVFDIKNENFGPDIISTTVKPLFCNNYYYLSRVNNFQFDIYSVTPLFGSTRHPRNLTVSNPSVNNIIIPEPTYREYYGWEYRTNDNYYLNDVTFVSYLTNEQHLNPHQPGYNARNDDGMFYHHSQVQFSAVQRDKEEWDWAEFGGLLKDTGTFALGVLFPESLIVDVSTKLVDFISLAIDGSTFYNSPLYFKDINNEIIFSSTNESTKEAQLASFNPGQTPYLSKESVLKLKCAHPVLLGVSNYATATHYTGTTKVWNTRYNSGIGLSIAYVNGNDFVNVISGKGHSSRIVEDREREELQFNAINSRVISVSPQFTTTNSQKINGLNKYSIKPEYSGKYIIEMWNPLTLVPPIVEIKNHYTN